MSPQISAAVPEPVTLIRYTIAAMLLGLALAFAWAAVVVWMSEARRTYYRAPCR
jgi:hypothetical protein